MRKIYILILFVSVAFVSCKEQECYDCETMTSNQDTTFCKGSFEWEMINDGLVVTDNVGDSYVCN